MRPAPGGEPGDVDGGHGGGVKKYGQEARTAGVFSLFEVIDINKEIAGRSVS